MHLDKKPVNDALRVEVTEIRSTSPHDLDRLKILVAEDNLVNQKVIVGQLKKLGITPQLVSNGQEALKRLERESFDVLLLDCQMPVMDGFTASRKIRVWESKADQNGIGNRLHIIALTANAMKGTEEHCLAAGMDAYITKPLNVSALVALLMRVPLTATTNVQSTPAIIDMQTIQEIRELSSEEDLLGELIDIYTDEAPARLAQITNATALGDMQALAFATHTLRGSSSTLGATKLAYVLDHLEIAARTNKAATCRDLIGEVTSALDEAIAGLQQHR